MKTAVLGAIAALCLGSVEHVGANPLIKQLIEEARHKPDLPYVADYRKRAASVKGRPSSCSGGFADVDGEQFPCSEIDFLSFVSAADLKIPEPDSAGDSSDIWGWLSPSEAEVTILTLDNGVVLLDSTDPVNPCIIAKLPSGRQVSPWGDAKVFENTLYTIKDRFSNDPETPVTAEIAVEVYDLLQFDGVDCSADDYVIPTIQPDFIVPTHGSSHNVIVNTETARLYTVGAEFCAGGLVAFDLTNRLEPSFIRCVDADGYTHDAQCVVYTGPDTRYQGREICLAFNEDTLTIWDVTDLATEPATLVARTPYFNQAYSHQGWFTRDMTKVLLDDELDELCNSDTPPGFCPSLVGGELSGVQTTSTNVFDVTDLENPILEEQLVYPTTSIDHNLYIWGAIHEKGWGGNPPLEFIPDPNFAYLNNYMAGLRVLDISSDSASDWTEVGFFDISPEATLVEFLGAWSGYMHPSGVYAISSIERGLFFLSPRMAFTDDFPSTIVPTGSPTFAPTEAPVVPTPEPTAAPVVPTLEPTVAPTQTDSGDGGDIVVLYALLGITIAVILLVVFVIYFDSKRGRIGAPVDKEVEV